MKANSKLMLRARRMGVELKHRLLSLQKQYDFIGDVRGRGLFVAAEFVLNPKTKKPATGLVDRLVEYCFTKGLILMPCGLSSIRFIPPLNIPHPLLEKGLEILTAGLQVIAQNYKKYKKEE